MTITTSTAASKAYSGNDLHLAHGVRRHDWLPLPTMLGFAVAVVTILITAWFSWRSQQAQSDSADAMARTLVVQEQIQTLGSAMKDAETGQRGYLLTGIDPSTCAVQHGAGDDSPPPRSGCGRASRTTARSSRGWRRRSSLFKAKLAEMEETIAARRNGDNVAAVATVKGDRGRILMERIRTLLGEMEREERDRAAERRALWDGAVQQTVGVMWGGSALLLLLTAVAAVLSS